MASNHPVLMAQKLGLSHKQRVLRLYRQSLKHLLSWTVDRAIFREQAFLMREQFDENKHLTDRTQIARVLEAAEKRFHENRHPQPYIHPTAPGGSKYERNMPPPPNALEMLPIEEQWFKEMTDWANEKH